MTSVSLFLDVHHVRTIPLTPEPSGLLPSPTRGEGDMRQPRALRTPFVPLSLHDGGGWLQPGCRSLEGRADRQVSSLTPTRIAADDIDLFRRIAGSTTVINDCQRNRWLPARLYVFVLYNHAVTCCSIAKRP